MSAAIKVSGRQVAAARALSGVSRAELAKACGVSVEEMGRIETSGSVPLAASDAERTLRVLDTFGVVVIPEGDGLGAGVRLKFTRLDAKQIGRMEGEGGNVGEDDVP
jgi:transcriptional regulator with XRE-family HTH domain